MSRTGFQTRLKSKKVEISKGKTSQMIIKGMLSERAVVKENRLGQMLPQERGIAPIRNLVRVTTKSKSETQTVSNGHVSQWVKNWGV